MTDRLRADLAKVFDAMARIHDNLVVVSGMRPGAEMIAAEAAIESEVPLVGVVGFTGIDKNLSEAVREHMADVAGKAQSVVQLERKEPSGTDAFRKAMVRRDAWLVAAADEVILVWDEVDNRYDKLFGDLDRRLGPALTVLHPPGD